MDAIASILCGLLIAVPLVPPDASHMAGTEDGACCCAPVVEVSSTCCSADAREGMGEDCDCRITQDTSIPLVACEARSVTGSRPNLSAPVLFVLAIVANDSGMCARSREDAAHGLDPPAGRTACIVFCSYLC